jgi:hypothetical protein
MLNEGSWASLAEVAMCNEGSWASLASGLVFVSVDVFRRVFYLYRAVWWVERRELGGWKLFFVSHAMRLHPIYPYQTSQNATPTRR